MAANNFADCLGDVEAAVLHEASGAELSEHQHKMLADALYASLLYSGRINVNQGLDGFRYAVVGRNASHEFHRRWKVEGGSISFAASYSWFEDDEWGEDENGEENFECSYRFESRPVNEWPSYEGHL